MFSLNRGDILCTRGRSWLARAIRYNQGSPRSVYPSVVNHCALVTVGGPLHKAWIIEGQKRVREGRLLQYHGEDAVFAYRPRNIPEDILDRIVRSVEAKRGNLYGFLEFIPQQLDHGLFGGAVVLRRLSPLIPGQQCSTLVAQAFYDEGYTFGKPAYAATPDDVFRFCGTEAWRTADDRKYELILSGIKPIEWVEAA